MIGLLKTMLPATMGAVLSAQGVPAAGVAAASLTYALNSLVPKRMKSAADIWVQIVGHDWEPLSEEQEEELASIVDVFLQIARKGTAQTNLRLLARVVAGQKASGVLIASEFMAYANILEALSWEEIEALAVLYKYWKDDNAAEQQMIRKARIQETLIPKVAINNEELDAIYEGLTRTGLLIRINSIRDFSAFKPSKKLDRLISLASIEGLNEK